MKEIDKIIKLQKKIAPELVNLIEERYKILKHIRYNQPIGRRALATQLELSECSIRNGVKVLKNAGLLQLSGLGMSVTDEGQAMVSSLTEYVDALNGLAKLEIYLANELGVNEVKIVPGDSEADRCVFLELGRVAARILVDVLSDNMVIAVSGGSTMAAVAEAVDVAMAGTLVVPTRGGLGEKVERQANHVASVMAGNLGGEYRLLHIPEILNDEALEAIKATDSTVAEIEQLIKNADVLVHGIGRADVMVSRRNHMPKIAEKICKLGVGETLGHYFDLEGKCIYTYCSNGFRLNDLVGVGREIAVAGGKHKAEAILAVTRAGSKDVLVIDEAAARSIQSIIKSEKSQKTF
ncbi:sugar-binding transcriptional regulator [Anaerosinus massiliensis]|uniref:sugar-binding transcriptional regulator n=1 Tax=Massilibacillus massiliensis TaxID=1806837 RepID=UPI000AC0DF7F|nr:sugar-binding domain-containing protein [Massilibacillus massiliensis]